MIRVALCISAFLTCGVAHAQVPAHVAVCFTPHQTCAPVIVAAIQSATSEIRVQAYGFTSAPILGALVAARRRGVDVRVILDKSNRQPRYTGATTMLNAGIPVWIDSPSGIAHSKIMVIDQRVVVGGSFNFTSSADSRNVENVTITSSPVLAAQYLADWNRRVAVSERMRGK